MKRPQQGPFTDPVHAMSDDASERPTPHDPLLSYRLSGRLSDRLEEALLNQCTRRGEENLLLRWEETSRLERNEDNEDATRLRFELRRLGEGCHLSATMRISRAGPTTYDILCEVAGGSRRWFVCRLPAEQARLRSPVRGAHLRRLGQEVAWFLRRELKSRPSVTDSTKQAGP